MSSFVDGGDQLSELDENRDGNAGRAGAWNATIAVALPQQPGYFEADQYIRVVPIAAVRSCEALPFAAFISAPSMACCRSAPEPLGVSRQSDDSRSAQRQTIK
jgi:hypothetical protein